MGRLRFEFLQSFKKLVAFIRIRFHNDGLGKVQREDAEDGFRIYYVLTALQEDLVRIILRDVHELFYSLSHFKRNFDGFHILYLQKFYVAYIIHKKFAKIKIFCQKILVIFCFCAIMITNRGFLVYFDKTSLLAE